MKTLESQWREVVPWLKEAKKILIVPSSPVDGDAVGSALALKLILEKMGKSVTINYSFEAFKRFLFLPGSEAIQVLDLWQIDFSFYDLSFFLDGGSLRQFYEETPSSEKRSLPATAETINLDHHLTNDRFCRHLVHDPGASSVCEMLFRLFVEEVNFDEAIATNLLVGLSTDTGHFRYSNTTPRVLGIAQKLLSLGASLNDLVRRLYYEKPLKVLAFVGAICAGLKLQKNERYAYFILDQVEWEGAGLSYEEMKTALAIARDDILRSMAEADFVFAINQKSPDFFNVSGRNRYDGLYDLSVLAQAQGGGGHANAASFLLKARTKAEAETELQRVVGQSLDKFRLN